VSRLISIGRQVAETIAAGSVLALTAFPLSIGFALLAGVPAAVMILTSIYSAFFNAALAGRYGVGGPNTAVAMLTGAALSPFAPAESSLYLGYVFALCVLVGVYQLLLALVLKRIDLMDYISSTVIDGITFGIGAVFVLTSLWMAFGLAQPGSGQWIVFDALVGIDRLLSGDGNAAALLISCTTVAVGIAAWQIGSLRRYAILFGVVAGFVLALALNDSAGTETVGWISLPLWKTTLPDFRQVSWPVIFKLASGPALAIALVGMLQTLSIAKTIRNPDEDYRPDREMFSQGLQHVFLGFFSGAPGSNSFNKSALNRELGGGRAALLMSAIVTVLMVQFAGAVVASIPMSALGGAMILVGLSMLSLKKYLHHLRSGVAGRLLFALPAALVVMMDIQSALFIGFGLSLLVHFWQVSRPNVRIEENVARDGRNVAIVTIDGGLFFGSVRFVEHILRDIGEHGERNILVFRTDHLTYLDVPGAGLFAEQAVRRRRKGDEIYIFITRPKVIEVLEKSGALAVVGEANIIHRDRDHPMKNLIYPSRNVWDRRAKPGTAGRSNREVEETPMTLNELAKRLRKTTLFSHADPEELRELLEQSKERRLSAGVELLSSGQQLLDHLIILGGAVEAQRFWLTADGVEKSYAWEVAVDDDGTGFALLTASAAGISIRALVDTRYIPLNGDAVDELLGWSQVCRRLPQARNLKVLHHLPFENLQLALDRMTEREVEAGETIVTQGDPGDAYYVILSGEAEVWQTDPFTDETSCAGVRRDGDAFGEEALLQNAYRNATVTMTTPGRLLVLKKADFDELLKPVMVHELDAETAHDLLQRGDVRLLDCRYDMEFDESRIPGAQLVSLDKLREGVQEVETDDSYIVYCRSGRRSKAAAFLLRERGINAVSLAGGIKDWPYEVDNASPPPPARTGAVAAQN
jgi:SulP family sulfate permease